MESKRAVRRWAMEEDVLLLFEHDPRFAAGFLRQHDDTLKLEPIDLHNENNCCTS